MPNLLAIDQSTSATKALLFDPVGNLIDKASVEHRQIYPRPGYVEHDAEEIWNNTLAALRALVDERRADPASINESICLSITNQRETIVVFERGTGRPLHNAIVWQDRRGDPICAALQRASHGELVTRKTGLKIDTYFSASKLTWLVRNHPEIARKLSDGVALIGTIDTYLIYRLTEGRVFATDHTNASRTLLFDISALKWDDELCGLFEVPKRALAEVRDSTAQFGETRAQGIFDRPIPICGVMGDSQASLFAHRSFKPGMAKVTLGSGSSVLLNIGPELRYGGDDAVATIGWTHEGKPAYSFEGIINYTGGTIQWLKEQLGLIRNASETEAAATSVADNGGVYFVPAFSGLSAPHWSAGARAAIVGMTAHANRNHVIRAALESVGYQIADALAAMKGRAAGVELRTINADGGATRNAFLMQFIADVTGLEVTAANVSECSPLGAALAGLLGMKQVQSFDELVKLPREVTTYHPSMPAEQLQALHAGWKRAVKQVLAGAE